MPVDGDIVLKAGLDTSGIKDTLNSLQKTVSKGLKNAIRIGFGVRSVYALIRKLRTALIDGFGELSQVHQPFNQAMSDIMSSLQLLRNSFVSAFAPIIEVVAPALSTFIRLMAEAVAQIGMFIAALTGKEYVRAGAVQVDYAESLDKSTSKSKKATNAIKDQTDAQKKLNKEITHFDDLVILHEKDDDSGSSSTTPTSGGGTSFSPVPIGDAVSTFAKDFLAAWGNADFTDIGRIVGEKLKKALDNIPWVEIKQTLRKIAKSIATFLNGFLEVPGLFTSVGTTLAQALNSVFEYVGAFVSNFHWASLGKAIKDLIIGTLSNIDWALIYTTVTDLGAGIATAFENAFNNDQVWSSLFAAINLRFGAVVRGIRAFLDGINWKEFGKNLGTGLNNGLLTFPWQQTTDLIVTVFKDAIDAVNSFITTVDWEEIVRRIANALNGALENFPWQESADLLINAINTAFNLLYIFVSTFDFSGLGTSISGLIRDTLSGINWDYVNSALSEFATKLAQFLNSLFDEDTFAAIGTTVGETLNSALNFLNVFGEEFDFTEFGNSLAVGINAALKKFQPLKLIGGIITIIKAIRDTLVGFLGGVEWMSVGNKLRDILKNLPWRLILLSFGTVIWQAINAVIDLAKGLFDGSTVFKPVKDALDSLQETINSAIENIDFEKLADGFKRIVDALAPAVAGFAAGFISVFEVLFEIGADFLNNLAGIFEKIANALGLVSPETMEQWGELLGKVAGWILTISLGSKAVGILSGIGESLLTIGGRIGDVIGKLSSTHTKLETVVSGLGGVKDKLGLLAINMLGVATTIGAVAVVIEATKEEIVDYDSEFKDINDAHETAINILSALAEQFGLTKDQVYELAFNMEGILEPTTKNAGDAIKYLNNRLEDSGIDVDDFKDAIRNMLPSLESAGQDVSLLKVYLDGTTDSIDESNSALKETNPAAEEASAGLEKLQKKAETADTKTVGVADAISKFNGLSLLAPVKLALIYAAIKTLGEKGEISEEDVAKLHSTLDQYDPTASTQNLEKVSTAFEDVGVSGEEFAGALKDSFDDSEVNAQLGSEHITQIVFNFANKILDQSKQAGTNMGDGMTEGISDSVDAVNTSSSDLGTSAIDSLKESLDENSPSRKTQEAGIYFGEGLSQGIDESQRGVISIVEELVQTILNTLSRTSNEMRISGTNLMQEVVNGMSSLSAMLMETALNMADYIINGFERNNWWMVGYNIGIGIYNGLISQNAMLETLAWNTAVNMYNAAVRALDIHSPSKKFAYIGEMTMKGLQQGILENNSDAIDAITDTANAVNKEAEDINPAFTLDNSMTTWIDALDDTLTEFSDTVIQKFDGLMSVLSRLGNLSLSLPDVVQGKVIPASMRSSNSSDLANATGQIGLLNSGKITSNELRTLLIEMFTQYMNLSWYMGDEQVARHANAGNLKLNRRYSTIDNI